MKNLIHIVLVFLATACFAQRDLTGLRIAPKYKETAFYSTSVTLPTPTNPAHLAKAKQWASGLFENRSNSYILVNQRSGVIAGYGQLNVYADVNKKSYPFKTTFQIEITANKYRLRFYDLALVEGTETISERQLVMKGSKTVPVAQAHMLVKSLSDKMKLVMTDFEKAMENK